MATVTSLRQRSWKLLLLFAIVAVLLGLTANTAFAQPTTTPSFPSPSQPISTPPTTPTSPSAPLPSITAPPPATQDPECGLTDLTACMRDGFSSFIDMLVGESLNWLLRLVGSTLLVTPTLDQIPRIGEIWEQSRLFVVAAYSLLVLVAGILVMGHQSVQTRYSIQEIAPRLVVGFLAANLSLLLGDQAIRFANAASLAVLGDGLDPQTAGKAVSELLVALVTTSLVDGGVFAALLSLALAILLIGLLVGYIVRVALTVLLLAGAPLALMCHGLPQTEGVAHWFWRAGAGVLGIQVGQSLTLVCALKVFLQPGGFSFTGMPTGNGVVNLIVLIALVWILVKIPTWVMQQVRVGGGGRSFIGGLARAFVFGKAMAVVGGKGFGGVGAHAAKASSVGSSARASMAPPDPPWPAQPRMTPTPEMVGRRLREAFEAERLRVARHPRVPSQQPQFLQPQPQQPIHDPAVMPATPGPAVPEFSSSPKPSVATAGPRPRASTQPQFQPPDLPRRRVTTPPAQPIRVAPVPPQLRFQPATPEATQASRRPTATPTPPLFQQAQPEPKIGDARRRVHTVAPPQFRAPKPAPGGEGK
ncbi:hypothetical protein [Lentzea sp. HUAS12]|uniref:hypothetical protein n=1 Tax=Lentzea sp. HUAS12 TaxID=2951806 RepID=UPI00209D9BA4|nr:hypothetical protein [Lentzea sp. HUAS12]USX56409.1 hypothetical protein ND450_20600 [Lentzea sp. HUAS12]